MSIKLIIVTHDNIGKSLLDVASRTLPNGLPIPIYQLSVPAQINRDEAINQLQRELDLIPADNEILILTDIFGATPCNIARSLVHNHKIKIVTGLNLPMLLRVLNYSDLSLEELTAKAVSGGVDGIMACKEKQND